jgi:hypothetical protein
VRVAAHLQWAGVWGGRVQGSAQGRAAAAPSGSGRGGGATSARGPARWRTFWYEGRLSMALNQAATLGYAGLSATCARQRGAAHRVGRGGPGLLAPAGSSCLGSPRPFRQAASTARQASSSSSSPSAAASAAAASAAAGAAPLLPLLPLLPLQPAAAHLESPEVGQAGGQPPHERDEHDVDQGEGVACRAGRRTRRIAADTSLAAQCRAKWGRQEGGP